LRRFPLNSAVSLWLAFGSFDFIGGQVLGKIWMIAPGTLVLVTVRALGFRNLPQ